MKSVVQLVLSCGTVYYAVQGQSIGLMRKRCQLINVDVDVNRYFPEQYFPVVLCKFSAQCQGSNF